MTREEAVKALSLMEHVESIVATYEPGEIGSDATVHELKEACRLAVAALCAQQEPVKLDRSRWKRCGWCDKDGVAIYEHSALVPEYCTACGRPLTEGAWAELERRMNGG